MTDDWKVAAWKNRCLVADAISKAMQAQKMSLSELARQSGKDRKTVARLLEPTHDVAIDTVVSAAVALGLELTIKLVPTRR